MLGAALNRLRPGSKTSEDNTHVEDMQEKERRAEPGSPSGSGISSGPTMVPSPQLEEKDVAAARQGGDGVAPDEKIPPMLQQGSREETIDTSFERKRTVQYSDGTNQAPETTATQSNAGLQHTMSGKRRRRGTTKSSARPQAVEEVLGREEAEELMKLVQGHLVLWPYDWYVLLSVSDLWTMLTMRAGLRRKREAATGCTTLISWRRWRSTTKALPVASRWVCTYGLDDGCLRSCIGLSGISDHCGSGY